MPRITEGAARSLPLLLPVLLSACGGDSHTPSATAAATFSVTETAPATALVGDSVTWTVTATNSGSSATTDVATLLVTPPSLSGLAVAATGASCGPVVSTLTCSIPSGLAAGASATVTLTGTTTTAGTLTSAVRPTGVAAGTTACATSADCATTTTVSTPPAAISLASAFPANGATAAQADTMLQMTFNVAPTLGTTGKIYVYKSSDNSLVDSIDISGAPTTATAETYGTAFSELNTEINALAAGVTTLSSAQRFVYYTPVTISGKTATIHLHDGKLAASTQYYVMADTTVFSDGNGSSFTGLSSAGTWSFTTGAAPTVASVTSTTVPSGAQTGTTSVVAVTVDAAGGGNFNTVQGALDWVMQNCGTGATDACKASTVLKQITINKGTYNELLFLRNVNNITLKGSTTTNTDTVVAAENFESYNPGSGGNKTAAVTTNTTEGAVTRRALGGGRAVFLIEGVDLLSMRYFTLQNTHVKATAYNNQAETFYYNGATTTGSRLVASNMRFLSAQDTIQTKGWAYFYNDYIAGDVDFIWGNAYAVMFDNSELHTVYSAANLSSGVYSGGYVFQARVYPGYLNGSTWIATPGFVVANSTLTADSTVPAGTTYLARSGGAGANCTSTTVQGSACDSVAYVNTKIGTHIATIGWYTNPAPSPTTPTAMVGWREWGSMDGSGAALSMTGRDTTYSTSSIALTGSSATIDLTSPTAVFSTWNNSAGWVPVP